MLRTQVFQNAVCNWRCWYCFVDFKLLAASRKHSEWLTPRDLIDLFERPAPDDRVAPGCAVSTRPVAPVVADLDRALEALWH